MNFDYLLLESLEDLEYIVEKRREIVRMSFFLLDGLMNVGVQICLDYNKDVFGKLDNVYLLVLLLCIRVIEII